MSETHIYQIFYSDKTRESRDSGFKGLDNMRNARPDWREYWPIRSFIQSEPMDADAYFGFFSPKFKSKTSLDSAAVLDFVAQHSGSADVILFSPFFDQIAYPVNMFEQGALQHSGIMRTFRECVQIVAPGIDFDSLVMDSTNTVFCNYFVAKPRFWKDWLGKCELIYAEAEKGNTDLARRLNESTDHEGGGAPAKVFVLERIASLMLVTQRHWRAKAYNPISLPWSNAPIARFQLEMAFLDALKIAYASQQHPQYLDAFLQLRQVIGRWLERPESLA